MNILTISTLFPNEVNPRHGVFVENRLRHLLASGEVESKVVAPIPWFPFKGKLFGEYGQFARVPATEFRHKIKIVHPRYLLVPKIGMNIAPEYMAKSIEKSVKKIIQDGFKVDIIDAHYFYPDGVAAVKVSKALNIPITITARGTDLNLIPQYSKPRQMIKWAAQNADGLITVCQALKDVLIHLDVPAEKITVLRNGVDLQMFSPPEDRNSLRSKLNIEGKTLLSVGHLIERKGHDLVIKSIKLLDNVNLLIAGDGEEAESLKRLVKEQRLESRVRFLGSVPHAKLKEYYGAVDALILASSREGWANVLLESMACGTPVVATNIWGTPEVVTNSSAGVLVERTPESISEGVKKLFMNYPDRMLTRRYAEKFSWDDTTSGQLKLFKDILAKTLT